MNDFRETLYQQYVSTFKKSELISNSHKKSYFKWCDHKILPLLSNLNNNSSILEIGCGSGLMLEYLQHKDFQNIKGIDISPEQIEIAKSKGIHAEVADINHYLNNNKDQYDAIIAFDLVEHFSKNELMILANQIYNRLKSNGRFIIQTPNGEGLFPAQVIYGDLTHITIFSESSLRQWLTLSGFDNFTFQETGPVSKNITGFIRLFIWKFIKLFANSIRKIETGKTQRIWTENIICKCQKPSSE